MTDSQAGIAKSWRAFSREKPPHHKSHSFLKGTDSALMLPLTNFRSLLICMSHYHMEAKAFDNKLVSLG